MSMREQIAEAMRTASMREGAVGGVMNEECLQSLIDAALDALTANPGLQVLVAGGRAFDVTNIGKGVGTTEAAGDVFQAMIKTIADGK